MKSFFPHYIRQWRVIKNCKQLWLAKQLGITASALSKIENYKTELTLSRAKSIASLLGIDMDILFFDPFSFVDA